MVEQRTENPWVDSSSLSLNNFFILMRYFYRVLISISNGQNSKKAFVITRFNKATVSLLNILWEEGFIKGYSIKKKNIKIFLKYNNLNPTITFIKFISTPGVKLYISSQIVRQLKEKSGLFLISTSKGLLTLKNCKKHNLGGIVFFFIK